MKISGPRILLHVEGGAVLVAACVWYGLSGASWGHFALLFFVPDVSMIAYVAGKRVGAWVYNAFHSYLGPIVLWMVSELWGQPVLAAPSVIWAAHIGFDRLLGYGLKYPSNFKDTHLGRV